MVESAALIHSNKIKIILRLLEADYRWRIVRMKCQVLKVSLNSCHSGHGGESIAALITEDFSFYPE